MTSSSDTCSFVAISLTCLGLQIAVIDRLQTPFQTAQVEEQALLVGGGAHFDQRPRAQDIFLDRRLDPPHGIGRKAEAAIGIELLHRLHQADIALGHDFADRQTVTTVTHSDLGNEAKVTCHELVGGISVAVLGIALAEHIFFLRFQHRELANFV